MKYSEIALKILAAKECKIIKTNAQFWKEFYNQEKLENYILNNKEVCDKAEEIAAEMEKRDEREGMVCVFDKEFPYINPKVRNKGEKPFLLFYKGNLSLLHDLNRNVAVIGLIDPDEQIVEREKEIVKRLVENNMVVVSGLALGCDTVAHKTCLEKKGKTIAILPCPINKIYPAENRSLADEIVEGDGLLLTEYYKDASSKYEMTSRLVARDRLQAMFSKAVILIASYRKGEGDSGSRHAVEAAEKYGIERYVMYNEKTDGNNIKFGLNKDLVDAQKAQIITRGVIDRIKELSLGFAEQEKLAVEQLEIEYF